MLTYGGVIRENDVYRGYVEMEKPYFVNCSGYMKLKSKDARMSRTRLDYYLIYLTNGSGHYIINGKEHIATAGDVILYRPNEEQNYYYNHEEQPELYWIHFTGNQIENLLVQLQFPKQNIFSLGLHSECINIFKNIIYEMQIKKTLYEQFCIIQFMQLFYQFSRILSYKKQNQNQFNKAYDFVMEKVMKKMHMEYQQPNYINYYANYCNMSVYQFSRRFKAFSGMTPVKYIEQLRIDKSKELLLSTNFNICEIANIVGYNDTFYFSKVFKKATGMSPTSFRNLRFKNSL